jgi:hypothetical protein
MIEPLQDLPQIEANLVRGEDIEQTGLYEAFPTYDRAPAVRSFWTQRRAAES